MNITQKHAISVIIGYYYHFRVGPSDTTLYTGFFMATNLLRINYATLDVHYNGIRIRVNPTHKILQKNQILTLILIRGNNVDTTKSC